jgi:hypothetical protein
MLRSLRVPKRMTSALALLLVVSCDNPVCGCLTPARAMLYGRVTNPAGGAVPGAVVLAELGRGTCEDDFAEVIGDARSGADGRYRMQVHSFAPPDADACLRASASPPSLSLLTGSDSLEFDVKFKHEGSIDSVHVDLVLREP